MFPSICMYVHLYVSDCAHVFMCSCAPVQLVTLAQCVAPKNTTDVQMFLLGKQTQQRPFSPRHRDCQNKSGPPVDLSSNSDSLIHRQITTCPLLKMLCRMCFYLHWDILGLLVGFCRILFLCMFVHASGPSITLVEHRGGALGVMIPQTVRDLKSWKGREGLWKTWWEIRTPLPPSPPPALLHLWLMSRSPQCMAELHRAVQGPRWRP